MTVKLYHQRRAAKQCVYCCTPSERAACASCNKRISTAQAKKREERRAARCCTYCGDAVADGRSRCKGCRDWMNEVRRDRYVPVEVDRRAVGLSRRWPDRLVATDIRSIRRAA